MTEVALASPLTGTLGQMPTLAELTAEAMREATIALLLAGPAWGRFAVKFTDDDVTPKLKWFRRRVEATRWIGLCDHPTELIEVPKDNKPSAEHDVIQLRITGTTYFTARALKVEIVPYDYGNRTMRSLNRLSSDDLQAEFRAVIGRLAEDAGAQEDEELRTRFQALQAVRRSRLLASKQPLRFDEEVQR